MSLDSETSIDSIRDSAVSFVLPSSHRIEVYTERPQLRSLGCLASAGPEPASPLLLLLLELAPEPELAELDALALEAAASLRFFSEVQELTSSVDRLGRRRATCGGAKCWCALSSALVLGRMERAVVSSRPASTEAGGGTAL